MLIFFGQMKLNVYFELMFIPNLKWKLKNQSLFNNKTK